MINIDTDFRKDFRHARKVIEYSGPTEFATGKYDMDKFYWMNTQNLNYISELSNNKNITNAFTITGSADNIFELVSTGAKNIIATDTNQFTKYVYGLKKAAFNTLNVQEYINYIIDHKHNDFLSPKVFKNKVVFGFEEDEEQIKKFWEKIFTYYTKQDLIYALFRPIFRNTRSEDRKMYSTYIHNKKYNNIKEKISETNIEIYENDALELLETIDYDNFDWIDISNILLFVLQSIPLELTEEFEKYIERLEKVVREKLSKDGLFVSDYMFKTINPKQYINYTGDNNLNMLDIRIKEIYSKIIKGLNKYFDLEFKKYNAIPCTKNNSVENNIGDYLVLSKVKNNKRP